MRIKDNIENGTTSENVPRIDYSDVHILLEVKVARCYRFTMSSDNMLVSSGGVPEHTQVNRDQQVVDLAPLYAEAQALRYANNELKNQLLKQYQSMQTESKELLVSMKTDKEALTKFKLQLEQENTAMRKAIQSLKDRKSEQEQMKADAASLNDKLDRMDGLKPEFDQMKTNYDSVHAQVDELIAELHRITVRKAMSFLERYIILDCLERAKFVVPKTATGEQHTHKSFARRKLWTLSKLEELKNDDLSAKRAEIISDDHFDMLNALKEMSDRGECPISMYPRHQGSVAQLKESAMKCYAPDTYEDEALIIDLFALLEKYVAKTRTKTRFPITDPYQ